MPLQLMRHIMEPVPTAIDLTLEFERFWPDDQETGDPTGTITATPVNQHWRAWCHAHNKKPCSQARFGQMMSMRVHEGSQHGYPRLHRRASQPEWPIRVVASNG
jgi:phage/plasmid-associated DNA primase